MNIRYFGTFHDASYSSYDMEFMTGYTSVRDAGDSLLRRYQMGRDDRPEFRENASGFYVPWEETMYNFPAVTENASIILYRATWKRDERVYDRGFMGEYRLTIGPRSGVVVEKW